jgi:hypothetical protein
VKALCLLRYSPTRTTRLQTLIESNAISTPLLNVSDVELNTVLQTASRRGIRLRNEAGAFRTPFTIRFGPAAEIEYGWHHPPDKNVASPRLSIVGRKTNSVVRSVSITRRLTLTVLALEIFSAVALIGAITVNECHTERSVVAAGGDSDL